MALKAGYVGVKRWLYEKLNNVAAGLQDNVNKNGSKNLLPLNLSTIKALNVSGSWADNVYTKNNVTFTVDANSDGSVNKITVGGSNASADAALVLTQNNVQIDFGAPVILSGALAGGSSSTYYMRIDDNSSGNHTDYGNGTLLAANKTYHYCRITVRSGKSASGDFYPMVRLATDLDGSYALYAKTNQQLTADIATDAATLDAHKTTINGIISAATGAADFAAFKTAMAALTPLTRSAAPDTREASPEVIEEDPEPVTRKSTKKTTTKEGE